MDFIILFMQSLPMWSQILLVLVVTFLFDSLYTLWTRRTVSGHALQAANYAAAIELFSVLAILSIVAVNNILIFPAIVGVWLGSFITVIIDEKYGGKKMECKECGSINHGYDKCQLCGTIIEKK